ncbi:rhodanese-like domain-containing protein [Thermodesulfobacteriota bacterium]
MIKKFLISLILLFLIFDVMAISRAESSPPKNKQTILGLYITAKEAYNNWKDMDEKPFILDVRTPEEYFFVGHAPISRNIPVRLLNQKQAYKKMKPVLEMNPSFITEVKKLFKDTDTIFIMCRSGSRSALAVNLLARTGFNKVYNIIDGFEGDPVRDPESYFYGKRAKNGWKNSGAPWTY